MNNQLVEPVERVPKGYVSVHSVFHTIQGEGPFAGTPAVFVRLAGCNLQCPWCDTDYTSQRHFQGPTQLLGWVADEHEGCHCDLIVITGGEPFRQSLGQVTRCFVTAGYRVQIETNGTLYDPEFPYELATIVCSPKTPRIHPKVEPHLAALKYVLDADHVGADGLPSRTMGANHAVHRPSEQFAGEIYVQPLDVSGSSAPTSFVANNANQRHLAAAVDSAVRHGYRLCIQTHKLTGLP